MHESFTGTALAWQAMSEFAMGKIINSNTKHHPHAKSEGYKAKKKAKARKARRNNKRR